MILDLNDPEISATSAFDEFRSARGERATLSRLLSRYL